jgi:hypothetical protein
MQTIDSYVIYSTTDAPSRPRRKPSQTVAVSLLVAVAVAAGFAFYWRAGDPSTTASRPKLDARAVAESSTRLRSDDEARIAAFQEAAAIAHLTLAASAAGGDGTPAAGLAFKPTGQASHKLAQKPAPKSVVVAPPIPQSRPSAPEVIMADLPATPQVDPAPADGKPQLLGTIAQDVERVPSEVKDFAHGMTDRMLGALADARARVGL